MTTPAPKNSYRIIRENSFPDLKLDPAGFASVDSVLERLEASRFQATKEANRLLLASLVFSGLFLIKICGLRSDLVLFDQKIFEVPYGIFVFCLGSQLSFCLNCLRSLDARVYDRQIKRICEIAWPSIATDVYSTIPNKAIWAEAGLGVINKMSGREILSGCLSVLMIPSVTLGLIVILLPEITGIYYLINWESIIVSGNIELQYYSVVFSSSITIIWLIQLLIIHLLDDDGR